MQDADLQISVKKRKWKDIVERLEPLLPLREDAC